MRWGLLASLLAGGAISEAFGADRSPVKAYAAVNDALLKVKLRRTLPEFVAKDLRR